LAFGQVGEKNEGKGCRQECLTVFGFSI